MELSQDFKWFTKLLNVPNSMDRPRWLLIAKYILLKFRLDILFRPLHKIMERWILLMQFSKWIHKLPPVPFNDFYTFKEEDKREKLYEFLITTELTNNSSPIDFLEFGVYNGDSIKWWVNRINNADSMFYGFDSFEGLPEDWGVVNKNTFSTNGKTPEINDVRCEFIKGLFQQTLHNFVDTHDFKRKSIIHLDADLYSATLFVLMTLGKKIKKGDIIIFDQFNSLAHEFKAFREFTESYYIEYDVIAASNNFTEVAVRIK